VFAGGHASSATNWTSASRQQTPQVPGPLGAPFQRENNRRQATTKMGRAAVYGANIHVPLDRRTSVVLGVREERGRVVDARQADRTLSATVYRGTVTLTGSVGTRELDEECTPIASAALSLAVTPSTSFTASAGRYAENKLAGTTDGRFLNAGFSVRLSGGEPTLPKPADAPSLASGMTRLAIMARDADRVELAGDFTKWELKVTERSANGVWYLDLGIPPGRYRYAFRIDGREWRTPEGAVTADDGFGGKSALLTIDRSTNRPQ